MSLKISATDISWAFSSTRKGDIVAEQWGNIRIDLSLAPTSLKSKYTWKKKVLRHILIDFQCLFQVHKGMLNNVC